MTTFNDPTSCNDLKLTLFIVFLIVLSAFIWFYKRSDAALNQVHHLSTTLEKIKQNNKHQSDIIKSLNADNMLLKNNNKSLNTLIKTSQQSIALLTQQLTQQKHLFNEKIKPLNNTISHLNERLQKQRGTLTYYIKQHSKAINTIKVTKQDLEKTQQFSQQQSAEYQQLNEKLAKETFKADHRLNKIIAWQQEVIQLKKQLVNTKISVNDDKRRFTIFEMKQDILFDQGKTKLSIEGQQTLEQLAKILRQYPNRQIAVQGHSDAKSLGPKLKKRYISNWQLAAARAASAIHYLQYKEKISPKRIMLVSYAHYRPKKQGHKISDFAANRRIEIILMPLSSLKKTIDKANVQDNDKT